MSNISTPPASSDLLLPRTPQEETHPYTVHTYYFGFTVPEACIGAYVYLRVQPYFGQSQGGVVIFQGLDNPTPLHARYHDYRTTMPWPDIDGQTIRVENGYELEFPKPGSVARLRYRSPDGKTSFEILQEAVTPLRGRAHITPGEDDHHDDPARRPGGSEQFMRVTGTLRLGGEEHEIDGFHVRDRSWNQVRTEDPSGARPVPPVAWSPICFGPHLSFNAASLEPADTDPAWLGIYDMPDGFDPVAHAWIRRDDAFREVRTVRRNVHEYHPILPVATRQTIEVEDEAGDRYRFAGEAIAMSPMPAWPNVGFHDSVYRWTNDAGEVTHGTYQEMCFDRYVRGVHARGRR